MKSKLWSCFRLKVRITLVLSTLMQCAAELKYCAGVQGYLRGRAAQREHRLQTNFNFQTVCARSISSKRTRMVCS